MKKKYFLTVLAVTLIVSLTLICFSGCRKKSDSTANKNTDSNEIKLSVGENSSEEKAKDKTVTIKDFESKYIRVTWSRDVEQSYNERSTKNEYISSDEAGVPTVLITDKKDLDAFLSDFAPYFGTESFFNSFESYDDAFFEKNVLLLTYIWEGSGSITHCVKDVSKTGDKLDITITRMIPQVGTCDMASRIVCTELSKENASGVEFINSRTVNVAADTE